MGLARSQVDLETLAVTSAHCQSFVNDQVLIVGPRSEDRRVLVLRRRQLVRGHREGILRRHRRQPQAHAQVLSG